LKIAFGFVLNVGPIGIEFNTFQHIYVLMSVYLRPTYEKVEVLELDLRGEDWKVLIQTQDGTERKVSLGKLVADGSDREIRESALRIIGDLMLWNKNLRGTRMSKNPIIRTLSAFVFWLSIVGFIFYVLDKGEPAGWIQALYSCWLIIVGYVWFLCWYMDKYC